MSPKILFFNEVELGQQFYNEYYSKFKNYKGFIRFEH